MADSAAAAAASAIQQHRETILKGRREAAKVLADNGDMIAKQLLEEHAEEEAKKLPEGWETDPQNFAQEGWAHLDGAQTFFVAARPDLVDHWCPVRVERARVTFPMMTFPQPRAAPRAAPEAVH